MTISPGQVVFDADDWDVAQDVAISAVDTVVDDGDVTVTVTHTVISDDERFGGSDGDGRTAAPVDVLVVNDDVAGISAVVEAGSPLSTDENGATVVLDVVLTAPPAAGDVVLVTVTSTDETEATVNAADSFLCVGAALVRVMGV